MKHPYRTSESLPAPETERRLPLTDIVRHLVTSGGVVLDKVQVEESRDLGGKVLKLSFYSKNLGTKLPSISFYVTVPYSDEALVALAAQVGGEITLHLNDSYGA